MAEGAIRQYFTIFVVDIVEVYGGLFFNRFPTKIEMESIEERYTENGSPGCIRAVD